MDGTSSAPTDAGVEGTMKTEWRINERMTNARPHPDPLPRHVFSGPDFSPSPPAEGGEGRGEEGFSACRRAGVSAVGLPSPRPFPRSFLTGRGSAMRALNTHVAPRAPFGSWTQPSGARGAARPTLPGSREVS